VELLKQGVLHPRLIVLKALSESQANELRSGVDIDKVINHLLIEVQF
jgi:hypothetical protein